MYKVRSMVWKNLTSTPSNTFDIKVRSGQVLSVAELTNTLVSEVNPCSQDPISAGEHETRRRGAVIAPD